jgi:hypothetical protein
MGGVRCFIHLALVFHLWNTLVLVVGRYVSKSFWTDRLERELQMVQLSDTRCSCIAILWVSLVCFAAVTLYVASQRVIPTVSVYFIIHSVQKLFDIPSRACVCRGRWRYSSISVPWCWRQLWFPKLGLFRPFDTAVTKFSRRESFKSQKQTVLRS